METIKNYLDNMFATLPKTNEMLKLKNDILSNMEEKYNEMKGQGKSENEAIGIVISEFGNIDELTLELGIKRENEGSAYPNVSQEEAEEFMAAKKQSGLYIGIGVVLCIMGGAMLILLSELADDGIIGRNLAGDFRDMLGLLGLFTLVIPAVAIFIYTGMKMEKYEYLKKHFELTPGTKRALEGEYNSFAPTHMKSVIVGVCLIIFAALPLLTISAINDDLSTYGLVATISIVAAGVYILVYFGTIKEGYSMLLKIGDFTKEKIENDKVIGAVAAVVWPLAVCLFLVAGFVYNLWHISWIIFPITGILFGIFCSVYSSMKSSKR